MTSTNRFIKVQQTLFKINNSDLLQTQNKQQLSYFLFMKDTYINKGYYYYI